MPSYKTGKWAKQILAQRREDGLWGNFHTLSCPVPGKNYTTEQAMRIFEPQNETALEVAYQWAQIAEKAFSSGSYNREDDISAFVQWKGRKPKSGFETGFGMFYHAALLVGVLPPKIED